MNEDVFGRRFFPEDYRAFCCGPMSAEVERFGGIESLGVLDFREHGGRMYPSLRPIAVFSRKGTLYNRPFMTAAVYFENRRLSGVRHRFCPEYPEIHPVGFRSSGYDLRLESDSACVRLQDSEDGLLAILISREHYYWQQGHLNLCQNQNSRYQPSWLPDELRGSDFNPDFPFPDHGVEITRKEPFFLAEENCLVLEISLDFHDYRKSLFAAVTADFPLLFRNLKNQWVLTGAYAKDCVRHSAIGCGGSLEQALQAARNSMARDQQAWQEYLAPGRFPGMPELKLEKLPATASFMTKFPAYQEAAVVWKTDRECGNRAAQCKYGYFAMWDQIFPLRDYLIMGMPEMTECSLRQIITYPHVDSAILISMQTAPALNEYLAFTENLNLVRELLPWLRKFFEFALGFCHPETGLLKNTLACAVDVPEELGVKGLFYESGINGWWYDFCRALQNMALSLGEEQLAEQAGVQGDRIQKHFLGVFYDAEKGTLLGMVPEQQDETFIPLHIYTVSMALEYAHGSALLRPVLKKMADFQVRELHHPLGHTAVPVDSPVPCINTKAFHMNQHLGHECVCARLGGQPEEALHLMKNYLEVFNHYGNAVETFNLCYCSGNQGQTADWQTFSATGAMQGILHGVLGIGWHRGGLYYMPADSDEEDLLRNFHFRNSVFAFLRKGTGHFVQEMRLNGRSIAGSCQLPADWLMQTGEYRWEVICSEQEPEGPVLLSAADLPVTELDCDGAGLAFKAARRAFSTLEIWSPSEPEVLVGGRAFPVVSCPGNIYLVSGIFRQYESIEIKVIGKDCK